MSEIFISHSSKDNEIAAGLVSRLEAHGHLSVFLDFDPANGIPAGRNWEQELYQRLRSCRAVIVLCSEHSMASDWCFAEITHARALGKHIFPVKVGPCRIRSVLSDLQMLDLIGNQEEAYQRLWRGLEAAGLDPVDMFNWDNRRAPYPGLMAFQEEDAAIFFGRDASIRDALDVLNRLQRFGGARLSLFLGASGSGKSSLVRAGVLPRLRQDPDRWLVVTPFRPLQRPVDELAIALSDTFARHNVPRDWKALRDVLCHAAERKEPDGRALIDLALDLRLTAGRREAVVLLTIDQLEEVLGYAPEDQASRFLPFVRAVLEVPDSPLMAVATLRSDFLGDFQGHPATREMPFETVSVGPLSIEGFAQVIEGPAAVAGVELEPGLVQAMVDDTETEDALPLLAFTLRELWERYGQDGRLEVEEYRDKLGGLHRSVARAAEAVLEAKALATAQEIDLRDAFVSMVRINEEGQYVRYSARWSDMPHRAHGILERFVRARLLVSHSENDERILEVAHEALFRAWERLKGWLDEDRRNIHLRDAIRRAAQDWAAGGQDSQLLVHRGSRLDDAESLARQPRFALGGQEREYLRACTDQREAEREAERQRREAEEAAKRERLEREAERQRLEAEAAAEREAAARRLTARTRIGAVVAVILAILATGFGWYALNRSIIAETERQVAVTRQLAIQASAIREEYPERAVLLAAEALRTSSVLDRMVPEAEQSLRDALLTCSGTPLILPAQETGRLRASQDGQWLLNPLGDKTAELWKIEGPSQPIRPIVLSGYTDTIESIFVSRNGRWAVTSHKGERLRVWDIEADGPAREIAVLGKGEDRVMDIDLDSQGRWLAAGTYSEHRLWDLQAGDSPKLIYEVYSNGGSHDPVAISPDGRWFAAMGYEKKASDDPKARYRKYKRGQKVILLDLCASNPSEKPVFLPVRQENLRTMLFTPDGRWLIAAGDVSERDAAGDHAAAYLWNRRDFVSGAQPCFTISATNPIYSLAVSPDSRWLATGVSHESFRDRTSRVWDLKASNPSADPFLLAQHQGAVCTMAFSSDSRFFATGAVDKLVRIWDLEAENSVASLRTLSGLGEVISMVTFDAGNKYVGAFERNGRGRFWNLAYLEQSNGTMLFAGQEDAVARVLISGDNRWVISRSKDETIRRWELIPKIQPPSSTTLGRFPGGAGVMAISPDGRWLASAAGLKDRLSRGTYGQRIPGEHIINLWDFKTNYAQRPNVLRGHEGEVRSLAFSADSQWLTSGSSDGTVRIWHLAASGEVKTQHVLKSPHSIDVLTISPDRRWLAATGSEHYLVASIRLWSMPFTTPSTNSIVLQMLPSRITCTPVLSISPDSHWMAAANGHERIVRLWDLSAEDPSLKAFDLDIAGETKDNPLMPLKFINNLAFSPDSRWLAVVQNQRDWKLGTIWLWDLSAGPAASLRPVPLRGHEGYITDLTFSPDAKRLATASADNWGTDNTIRIWHLREMETSVSPIVLRGHRGGVSTLAFSPDGRWLISGSVDRTLQRWPMTTEDLLNCARKAAGRNLSSDEWIQYFVGQEYRKTFETFPGGTLSLETPK